MTNKNSAGRGIYRWLHYVIVPIFVAIVGVVVALFNRPGTQAPLPTTPSVSPPASVINNQNNINITVPATLHPAPVERSPAPTTSPPKSDGELSNLQTPEHPYRLTGFSPEDAKLLSSLLTRLRVASADVSLADAARAGGKNVWIRAMTSDGQIYEDNFGVPTSNVVMAITRRVSENLSGGDN
jgi:hypothetical protein